MMKIVKTIFVSFVFVALMLGSAFAGAVSAGGISEDLCENTILSETGRYDDFNASNSSDNLSLSSEIDTLLNNKPVFLFFYTDWCHFCQQQKPIIDELEQEYADKFAFIRVNAEENPQAMDEFGVTGFPAMFLIVDKNEHGYVYQEFDGVTEKEILKESFDYVIENGGLPEDFGSPQSNSSFQFNQTDFANFSIVNQKNLTLAEFRAELANDSEFKELHDYARELGYVYPWQISEIKRDGSTITTVIMLSADDGKSILLTRFSSKEYTSSLLIKANEENDEFFIFDKDGGIKVTASGEISPWVTHHSCSVWWCTARGLGGEGWTERESDAFLRSVLGTLGNCLPCAPYIGLCSGLAVCAFPATMPACPAAIGVCLRAVSYPPCMQCAGAAIQDLAKFFDKFIEIKERCEKDPSKYSPYPGWECRDTNELKYSCEGDVLVKKTCYDCEHVEVREDCALQNKRCGPCYGGTIRCCIPDCDDDGDCSDGNFCTIDICTYNGRCAHRRLDCDDDDPCTIDYCNSRTATCIHRPKSGCDHPDENYDVSTSKITLNSFNEFNPETIPHIAVLRVGEAESIQKLLTDINEPGTFVDLDFSQDDLRDYPILIIPSGGLYGLDSLQSFKSKLSEYVQNGGNLIVFSQQHGYEFNALPGGEVSGYGWLEDQSCHYKSVGISTYHPILSGQDSATLDVNVDGYFTQYPENTTILLSRTKNGMPAMLLYGYGSGNVLATTAYTDSAYTHYQSTKDGMILVRDMIAWTKDGREITTYGMSNIVNVSISVMNVFMPIPSVEYPHYEPGDTVDIPINVTNYANITSDKVSISVFDPDYEINYVNVSVAIPPKESRIVTFTYPTTTESKRGTYFTLYSLYAGETVIGGGFGGFALGVNTSNLSLYELNFTLTDPDKKITKQENISVYVPPGEIKTVNFTYANPSELGIWNLEYETLDYNNTLIDYGAEKFAVSNYAENPDGFVYHGTEITYSVTSDSGEYAYGSNATYTIHIWNNGDIDKNITVYWEWTHEGRNLLGTFLVPANDSISVPYTYNVDTRWGWRFWTYFYDKTEYLGLSSVGGGVFSPTINIDIETDKTEYGIGENVLILSNLKNKENVIQNFSLTVRTLDPDNKKIYEDSFNINLSASASENKTLDFALPIDSENGVYIVTAEAYDKGNKIGSASTYFKVCKDYFVRVGFDNPDKIYRARQNMTVYMNATKPVEPAWNSMLNISIPSLGFNDTRSVTVNPNETESISYHLSIPENISTGKHDVIVTISYDNSVVQDCFFIPESKLQYSLEKTDYSAGENVSIKLENTGGVDTNYTFSAILQDPYLDTVFEDSKSGIIKAGATIISNCTIPRGAINGAYFLRLELENLRTDEISSSIEMLSVSGLNAFLTSKTDKKVYSAGEDITVLTNITNLDGEITGATLNLKVLSSKPPLPPKPCVVPTDNLYINSDTTLCPGIYNIPDSDSNGVIIINANGVVVEGNDTALIGAGGGYGIYNPGFEDVTIRNIKVKNYDSGIYLINSDKNTITNNNASNNNDGILLDYSSNNSITNNTANSNYDYGIYLISSSNNSITNNNVSNNDYGIRLYSSSSNTVTNNTASNNDYGIHFSSSSSNTITNNTANSNNYFGIYLYSSSNNNTITNNTANSNNRYGIILASSSNNNTITNNTANSNYDSGIVLDSSSNNTITNNTASNNEYGISLGSSSSNTISNNEIDGSSVAGFYIDGDSYYNSIVDNKVNGDYYYHYVNARDLIIEDLILDAPKVSSLGKISLINCTNVTLRNLTLANNYEAGVFVYQSNDITIDNNTASNNWDGIRLDSSSNNTITNNTASNNDCGIHLYSTSNNTITNNNASNNYDGIVLYLSSNNNIITNNTANSNYDSGIHLDSSSSNTITNNTANSNNYNGIYLVLSSSNTVTNNTASNNNYGIILYSFSSNNTITNNTANSNNYYGIRLHLSSNNTVTNNTASNNYDGIILDHSSSNNTIISNTASSNNNYGIYLYYSGSNNTVTNNTASNNYNGIGLSLSSSNTISNNEIDGSSVAGFYIDGDSYYNSIVDNKVNGDYYYHYVNARDLIIEDLILDAPKVSSLGKISLINCTNVTLRNLTLANNYQDGVFVYQSNDITIDNNNASNNHDGIRLYSSSSNTITNNTASNNYYGIHLYLSSSNNTVTNNTASNNAFGIYLSSTSNNNTITNNNASNNQFGIHLLSFSTDNVLSRNIFCSNSQKDISNSGTETSGDNNTCNTTQNWNDEGTTGCTYLCTDSSAFSTNSFVSDEYIFSNQPPLLDFIPDVTANETDLVVISPTAADPDNDTLVFTFTPPLNNSGMWQTTYGDAGIYTTTVSVSDGELTDSQNVVINVLNVSIDQDNATEYIPTPTATPVPIPTITPTPTLAPTPTPTPTPTEIQPAPTPAITDKIASNKLEIKSMGIISSIKEGISLGISQILTPVWAAEGDVSPSNVFTSSSSNSNPESYTIWEENLVINVTDFANISTYVGELNATGKLYLYATLYSSTGQIIAYNISSFYIADKDLSLTMETDKRVYKPNETINIYGEMKNHGSQTESCNLSIKKDGDEIFADTFTLNPDETQEFATNTSSNTPFTLEGTVNGAVVTDFVRVESPSINVSVIAPDVVGVSPFNVAVLIENTGGISADLNVNINSTWNITIPEGESRLLESTMSIKKNLTLNVTISGDVNRTIQKEIFCGENARINITPEDTYLDGTEEIHYVIENIGLLDSGFNATFSIDNQTVSEKLFVPKDENITDSVSFNLTRGAHLLRYVSPFEAVNVTINVLSPPEFVVTSIYPEDMNFTLRENVTITFVVENIGGTEGEATLKLSMPDFEDTNRTWIRPGEKENISFNLTIPDDLEEKSYKGIYELDGKRDEFRFFVQGANISVNASLDKKLYEEGESAILTLNVDNERNIDLNLYSRVKFNGYDNVSYFNLTGFGSETLTFDIPVTFTGDNKILYTVYMDTGRSLYINSMYAYEKKPDVPIRMYTDRDVYNIGEDVTIQIIDVTRTDLLNLTAPDFTYNNTISGPTTLNFTLPELRSGTYYIEYTFGNFSSSHPFDVVGYSARILEAGLDKEKYHSGDAICLGINIEAKRNVSGLLRTLIYNPDNELIDEFEANETLTEGENEIEVSRRLSTSISGIHVVVYLFYADLSGHSLTLLASGAEYFDAEGAGIYTSLATGWNMISLPLQPANISASSVLQTIPNTAGNMLYRWNASKDGYDAVYGAMELELGKAYWTPITADGTWMSTGTEIHGVQVVLTPGWNMIGVPCAADVSATDVSVTVGADTYNLVDAVQNGYIGGIFYSWNAADGEWDAAVISDAVVLNPGIGYFANVNQGCTITYP